jgi:hypothetical protein
LAVYNNLTGAFYKEFKYPDSDGAINQLLPEGDYTVVFIANNTAQALLVNTATSFLFPRTTIPIIRRESNFPFLIPVSVWDGWISFMQKSVKRL